MTNYILYGGIKNDAKQILLSGSNKEKLIIVGEYVAAKGQYDYCEILNEDNHEVWRAVNIGFNKFRKVFPVVDKMLMPQVEEVFDVDY